MENRNDRHGFGMGREGARRETTGNDGNLPMIGYVISLLSALVSIIGIISENLGNHK